MNPDQTLTLYVVKAQLELAMLDMELNDLLKARERLALVVIALDRVTYPDHA